MSVLWQGCGQIGKFIETACRGLADRPLSAWVVSLSVGTSDGLGRSDSSLIQLPESDLAL